MRYAILLAAAGSLASASTVFAADCSVAGVVVAGENSRVGE